MHFWEDSGPDVQHDYYTLYFNAREQIHVFCQIVFQKSVGTEITRKEASLSNYKFH